MRSGVPIIHRNRHRRPQLRLCRRRRLRRRPAQNDGLIGARMGSTSGVRGCGREAARSPYLKLVHSHGEARDR